MKLMRIIRYGVLAACLCIWSFVQINEMVDVFDVYDCDSQICKFAGSAIEILLLPSVIAALLLVLLLVGEMVHRRRMLWVESSLAMMLWILIGYNIPFVGWLLSSS